VLLVFAQAILVPLFLSSSFGGGSDESSVRVIEGKVSRVVDGDTFILQPIAGGKEIRVRLGEIDAPEHDQPFGKESTRYLQDLIQHKHVIVKSREVDRFGRHVGIVYDQSGVLVNDLLVEQGYAWAYDRYKMSHTTRYSSAQAQAKTSRLGLWKQSSSPIHPSDWRKKKK
jgi:endonuclease YncB( thermonuclease family)